MHCPNAQVFVWLTWWLQQALGRYTADRNRPEARRHVPSCDQLATRMAQSRVSSKAVLSGERSSTRRDGRFAYGPGLASHPASHDDAAFYGHARHHDEPTVPRRILVGRRCQVRRRGSQIPHKHLERKTTESIFRGCLCSAWRCQECLWKQKCVAVACSGFGCPW